MAEFTPVEQILLDVLEDWALKGEGIVLTHNNPRLFVQLLRAQGLELNKLNDIQKIRNEHKVISSEILQSFRTLSAAKRRLELLETGKEEVLFDVVKKEKNG
jgi:hypothetical protein